MKPQPPQPFTFAVINDLHYIAPQCSPWLDALSRQVNATPDLDLALILGDLAELGTLAELSAAKKSLDLLNIPYYVIPGNHDGPPNRPMESGDAGLADYLTLFPKSRNYTFTHKGWQFLALDTTNGSEWKDNPIPSDTRAYAEKMAHTLDPAAPTILFTHFPLDPTVRFAMGEGYELLEILQALNLRIVFSGHYHGLSENIAPNNPTLKLLTNRCVSRTREVHDGSGKKGYFICRANEDLTVSYRFVEFRGPQP